jgi:hypothetical protein
MILQVAAIHYTDGKLIGVTVHRGDASLHCIDLTRVKPFVGGGGEGGAAAARSAGGWVGGRVGWVQAIAGKWGCVCGVWW